MLDKAVDAALKLGWDFPYRLLASVAGMLTVAAYMVADLPRASDVLLKCSTWVGVDLNGPVSSLHHWMSAGSRRDGVGGAALVVMLFSGLAVAAWANRYVSPGRSRASATFVLATSVYFEAVGTPRTHMLPYFLLVCGVLLAVAVVLMTTTSADGDAVSIALIDVILATIWAAVLPIAWLLDQPKQMSEAEREEMVKAARAKHAEGVD